MTKHYSKEDFLNSMVKTSKVEKGAMIMLLNKDLSIRAFNMAVKHDHVITQKLVQEDDVLSKTNLLKDTEFLNDDQLKAVYQGKTYWKRIREYTWISTDGIMRNVRNHQTTTGSNNGSGYLITLIDGKTKSMNRLVYMTFIQDDLTGLQIDHINGNRKDNRLSNLQALTMSQNLSKRVHYKRFKEAPIYCPETG